ncbi:metallophosphoesterase [Sporosarcina sp. P13]|uniref:metallophosphoesterase family protein n=1 Tax=Sporosarcina sp. P13 TaxID=2048263 RepID=UPI001304004B|nr:metallophosphoesterase family protein [Sporosarcina sp. P13]
MQYALLGDIHSSLDDLTAVLEQISSEAPGAVLIGTGDLYECTVSKKKLHGQVYACVGDVIKHPFDFDAVLTFPSVYGNQEERILLITEQSEPLRDMLQKLPETVHAGEAIVIHGHQWKPEERAIWLDKHLPEATIVFHGHTHRSSYTQDGKNIAIPKDGIVTLSGQSHVINVGAVVESKEWVLFDTEKRTVRFMQVKKG